MCGPLAVADRKPMADGLGQVRLGGCYCLSERFTKSKVRCDCGGVGAPRAMSMGALDKFRPEQFKKTTVVEQVRRAVFQEVSTFDQHVPASQPVYDLGRRSSIGEIFDLNPRQLLCFMDVGGDYKR